MKKLLQTMITVSLCCLLTTPELAQSSDTDHTTVDHSTPIDHSTSAAKSVTKHHKFIKKAPSHGTVGKVCLSCIGSEQPKS